MATSSGRTRTRLSPEQRKEQLLKFALESFSKRGIGRAGHADIADMAHVSVATVFNYFSTREELVDAVLNEAEREFHQLILESTSVEHRDVRSALSHVALQLIDAALEDKDWLKVWFEWSTSIREDIWPNFVQGKNVVLDRFTILFSQSIESKELETTHTPLELARMFDGICYILYLQTHQQPDKDALARQANSYIDMLCS